MCYEALAAINAAEGLLSSMDFEMVVVARFVGENPAAAFVWALKLVAFAHFLRADIHKFLISNALIFKRFFGLSWSLDVQIFMKQLFRR